MSLVARNYSAGGTGGIVGLIGPTRMDYQRAIGTVRCVADGLSEALGHWTAGEHTASGTTDYYGVLGVDRAATAADIKKAFRRRARETHPDASDHDDAEERFKAVNEAYEVLSDPEKREMYDRFGTADPRAAAGGGFGDFGDFFGAGGVEDLFSAFFGNAGASRPVAREGRDMGAQVVVTLPRRRTAPPRRSVSRATRRAPPAAAPAPRRAAR